MKPLVWIFLGLTVVSLRAEDSRTVPMDMYLIIDGSSALQRRREDAVRWICSYAVDGLLQEGDRLSVWVAGEAAKLLFSETLGERHTKESVKNLLLSIKPEGPAPDYAGAVREASGMINSRGDGRLSYTLLISGTVGNDSALGEAPEMANLLRYSRVREFAGWKALVTAPGIGPQVHKAASAYMY